MMRLPGNPTVEVTDNTRSYERYCDWLFSKYGEARPQVPTYRLYGQYFNSVCNKFDYREYCAYRKLQALA